MSIRAGDRVYYGGDTDGHLPIQSLTGTVCKCPEGMYVSWDSWQTKQRWHVDANGGGISQPQRTVFRVMLVKESAS